MKISSSQFEAMASNYRAGFIQRFVRHLYNVFPDRMGAISPFEARDIASKALQRLHSRGFRTEQEIASLMEYVMVFGLDLDASATREILDDSSLDNGGKTRRLGDLALSWDPRVQGPRE